MTVLIVDDEKVIRDVLKRSCRWEGYETILAEDGVQALERMAQSKVDVVISDIKMPRMNGLDLLVEIKDKYPRVPVIMISAYSEYSGADLLAAGAEEFITKPFKIDELRYAMLRALKKTGRVK